MRSGLQRWLGSLLCCGIRHGSAPSTAAGDGSAGFGLWQLSHPSTAAILPGPLQSRAAQGARQQQREGEQTPHRHPNPEWGQAVLSPPRCAQ